MTKLSWQFLNEFGISRIDKNATDLQEVTGKENME